MSAAKANAYGDKSWTYSRPLPYFDPRFHSLSDTKGSQPMTEMCGFDARLSCTNLDQLRNGQGSKK